MREFRIKVNNEKTYVVKANDYNQAVKTLHSKLRDDNAVSDSIGKYTGEDAIKTNGFVKIKEDGDWTSYKYNGSDFDDAVFKIHQYNPSLIAFISNGNRTITVRNKYLNDSVDTAQGEIEVLKSFGFDYKDGKWVKESNSNDIIVQPDYHYVSVIGPGDTEKHCKKYQYQSAGMLKKIITSNIKDSSIKDAGEEIRYLEGMKFNGIPYTGWAVQHWTDGYYTFDGKKPYIPSGGRDALLSIFKQGGFIGQWKGIKPDKGFESYFRHSTAVPAKDKLIESGSKEALSKNIATEIKSGKDPKQAAAIAYSVQRENDSNITDYDPVKVEKIIRKERSALGITYYIFQTKSNSGATIYYEVTDKTYHGEPTYSGGGVISFSLKTANDSLDSHLLSDKLKAKYGEKEGTKRYLHGENDSAIHDMAETDMSMLQKATRVPAHNIYHNRISYDDLKRTINKVMEEGNDKDVVNILIGQLAELKKDYETDINNSKLDKEETKRHYNEYKRLVNNYKNSQISKEYTKAVNNFLSAIKDSNNIKNRKSYTIKVGDKQYKVFAESESEAIDKYIKSKKQ